MFLCKTCKYPQLQNILSFLRNEWATALKLTSDLAVLLRNYVSVSFDNKYSHKSICKEETFLIWCWSPLSSINWTWNDLSLLSDPSCCAVYFGPALDCLVISLISMKSLLLLSHALSTAVITCSTLITMSHYESLSV